jgi:hypothetical protein
MLRKVVGRWRAACSGGVVRQIIVQNPSVSSRLYAPNSTLTPPKGAGALA